MDNYKFYPTDVEDENFTESLLNKLEFRALEQTGVLPQKHQIFLKNLISPKTPYSSILVKHDMGTGKAASAILIAENFLGNNPIYVMVKNKNILNNFRLELLVKHTSTQDGYNDYLQMYISEFEQLSQYEQLRTQEQAFRRINKQFKFLTMDAFVNQVDKNEITNFSNSLLIIDEVHNVTGNDRYDSLMKVLERSVNVKMVLLSATPMFDSIKEIFEITNLLNKKKVLPIRNELVSNDFISVSLKRKIDEANNDFLQNALISAKSVLTLKGQEELIKNLKGKVSYLKQNSSNFPKRINIGSDDLQLVTCQMSDYQFRVYKNKTLLEINKGGLFKEISDASTIVYPNGETGSLGFKSVDLINKTNLKMYSNKISTMMEFIEESPGIVMIYSNYVTEGGTALVEKILKLFGYTKYKTSGGSNIGHSYIVFSSNMSDKYRNRLLSDINSIENKTGDRIRIIIGSPAMSEGISFKCVRQVHLLEPAWNTARIEQVIGRTIRNFSHVNLPESERNVQVYRYASTFNDTKTIDLIKYKIADLKDHSIKHVEYLLKQIAIDCNLLHSVNKMNPDFNFTRDCEYSECDFKCIPDLSNKLKLSDIDISTFDPEIHANLQLDYFKTEIKKLFKTDPIWTLNSLQNAIDGARDELNKNIFYYTLDSMIKNKETIFFRDIPGILLYSSSPERGSWRMPTREQSSLASPVIFGKSNDDYKSYLERYFDFKTETTLNINEYIKYLTSSTASTASADISVPDISVPDISWNRWDDHFNENKIIIDNAEIYGTFYSKFKQFDGIFRIVDRRFEKKSIIQSYHYKEKKAELVKGELTDTRRHMSGLSCSSYTIGKLTKLLEYLNLETNQKKIIMCETLQKYFIENGLMLK